MRQGVESLESDVFPTLVALAEGFGRLVEPAQRLVDVKEEPPFLRGEQERFFALHRIGALIGHMERVGTGVAVGFAIRTEGFPVVPQLLQHALPFFEQTLFEMLQVLLGHRLRLLSVL